MIETCKELFHHIAEWRSQIFALAKIDMGKQVHGTALGWIWIFVKPALYLFCFYFALNFGIRTARGDMSDIEYFVWLACGIIPWFFMQSSLSGGAKIFSTYKFLVCRLKFPIDVIPIFRELSLFFVHLLLLVIVFILYFITGHSLDIYFVQLPFVMVFMFVFFIAWSFMMGPLCAMSKDLANLIEAIMTPIFWLSGVIFDVNAIANPVIHWLLCFNPVTFFVGCYRNIFIGGSTVGIADKTWLWSDPQFFICGLVVFVVTVIAGLFVFSRLKKDIADVL
ncbi:MAG: ABC transporter permease [Coriobacteriaceae bacterium]|nr:ABC transporter permease [Coriobacteriaceae bacterium]